MYDIETTDTYQTTFTVNLYGLTQIQVWVRHLELLFYRSAHECQKIANV